MKVKNFLIILLTLFSPILLCPLASGLVDPDYVELIPADSHWSLYVSLNSGDTWTITYEVTAGGAQEIDVYVVDDDYYALYDAGYSFSYYRYYERYTYNTFSFEPLVSDTYYVIFDNYISIINSKTIEVITDIDRYSKNPNPMIDGYLFASLLVFSILGVLAILVRNRTKLKHNDAN
ncbi:hypothetical protein GF325_04690 [Candidatus Bathyarchaeota archaeon]|nr:hypothetical protein [Candidatus Bathyarchaeota archaeon]